MNRHGHVTILVDDDVSLSIMRGVAERCGGCVRGAAAGLELTLPHSRPAYPPELAADRRPAAIPETIGVYRIDPHLRKTAGRG